MSYSDEKCPCGGKKQRDTMICTDCESAFSYSPAIFYCKNKGVIFKNPYRNLTETSLYNTTHKLPFLELLQARPVHDRINLTRPCD